MIKSRTWAWTINAVGTDVPFKPEHLKVGEDRICYFKYQLERGEAGTLHYQGCIRFEAPKALGGVKKTLKCMQAHVEVCKNWTALRAYCGKADTRVDGPWEEGNPGEQGKRNDLRDVCEAVKSGTKFREIVHDYAAEYVKYHKGLAALRSEIDYPRRRDNLRVYCLYGPSGTGKSFFVHTRFPDCYSLSCLTHPWADGYAGERVCLIDDFGPGLMPLDMFKRLLDVYPVRIPVKGGMVSWNPEIIFITTNHEIGSWYPACSLRDLEAIRRRITLIEMEDITDGSGFLQRNEARILLAVSGENLQVRSTEGETVPTFAAAPREPIGELQIEATGHRTGVLVPTNVASTLSVSGGESGIHGTRLMRTQTWVEQLDTIGSEVEFESDSESRSRSSV